MVHNSALSIVTQLSLTCSSLTVENLADSETGCWLLEQYLLDIKKGKYAKIYSICPTVLAATYSPIFPLGAEQEW